MTEITDARGRKITLRPLDVMQQVRLLRAIGPEQSMNQPYVNIVQVTAAVVEIDGVPLPFPTNERMIDAAIARLGDDGLMAVTLHHRDEMIASEAAAQSAKDEGEKPPSPLEPSGS